MDLFLGGDFCKSDSTTRLPLIFMHSSKLLPNRSLNLGKLLRNLATIILLNMFRHHWSRNRCVFVLLGTVFVGSVCVCVRGKFCVQFVLQHTDWKLGVTRIKTHIKINITKQISFPYLYLNKH